MGLVIAFPLLLIGIIFVLFENGLQRLSSWLLRGCQHLLVKPPSMEAQEFSEARYIIACLAYLVFPSGVLYGEAINLQSILSQLNETGGGASAAVVDQASMLLYLFVPAFLFAIWLEFRDMPLFGLRLFPKIDEKVKKWLGMLTLVVLILACVVFLGIWLYRALALAHPDALNDPTKNIISLPLGLSLSLADIRIFLFALMGIVAFYTTAFAVIGLKVGLIGLGVLITGGLWVIASVLQFFPCHVAAHLLSYPCLFLTGGRLTPYTELADIKTECELLAARNEANKDPICAYPERPKGEKPSNAVKVHSFLFAGDLGSDFFPDFAQHVVALGAHETILSSGVINPAKPEAELLTLPGTRSLSSTPEDLKRVHDTARKDDDRDDHVYRTLCNLKGEKLIKIHTTERLESVPAAFFFILDKRVLCPAQEMLRTVHGAFPAAKLVVVTAVTAADRADEKVQRGLTNCQTLWNEGVLAETLLFDDLDCPFLKNRQDKQTLYSFMSRAVASLLVAKKHSWHNLAATEVLERLSQQSAFITVSFASAPVPTGLLPARYGVTKVWPGKRAEKGTGDVNMTVTTLKGLIRRIYDRDDSQYESTRSLAAPVNDRASSYLVYHAPLSHREVAKLEQMRRELNSFAGIHFPLATLLLARCQGVPYGDEAPAPYLVGVSCFYSVHRSDFSAEQTVEAGKGSRALPQPQQFAAAQEQPEEEGEPLAPFIIESEGMEQRGNGAGNGQGSRGKGTAKPTQRTKPNPAKRGQQKQAGEGKKDTAQEPSTAIKRGRGRPRKLPDERS